MLDYPREVVCWWAEFPLAGGVDYVVDAVLEVGGDEGLLVEGSCEDGGLGLPEQVPGEGVDFFGGHCGCWCGDVGVERNW